MANVLFEVPHSTYSLQAQKRPGQKICSIDNGLRNAVSFRFSEDEGRLAGNPGYLELLRSGAAPFYWKKMKEVDFVIKSPASLLTAINVSYTDTIPAGERRTAGLFSLG